MEYYIDPHVCPQDHACPLVVVCPVSTISQDKNGLPVIDDEKCIKCGKCAKRCPMHAVVRR
jgi:Fe-S-cluster-containing hydrogenase component 2